MIRVVLFFAISLTLLSALCGMLALVWLCFLIVQAIQEVLRKRESGDTPDPGMVGSEPEQDDEYQELVSIGLALLGFSEQGDGDE